MVAKTSDVLGTGPVFGINMADRTKHALDAVHAATGCRPTWVQFFVSVAAGVTVEDIRKNPGTPLMSLEPWRAGEGPDQPDFTLRATIDGKWDREYLKIARAVVQYRDVIMLRFAHEMNGRWYPWGPVAGNTPAEYTQAWRHVVALFRHAGATNVLWVWSPNILRGAVKTPVDAYYPGNEWVDFVGVTGYGVREHSPEVTYAKTFAQIRATTDKPIILTETGAQHGPAKLSWIRAFGPWLRANPDVAGFVWSQRKRGQGGTADWRFDDDPANLAAFKATLSAGRVPCQP
ncbi:glycosyl hydrolase [Micromonospora soli]|uniref:glycoside hydrolase family 26 protein n=1 Tax=Micromonospora sp. NBRC 110009 TaxID=3061627 RepID=UPI0026715936|nr:glycosyl hydrolase [Micromonospora sp. NBRC 110009]WKT96972.1 glycosyl hydrolase [Micromonospora sp. NBRC 110009]